MAAKQQKRGVHTWSMHYKTGYGQPAARPNTDKHRNLKTFIVF
jgi:hypothetical protein